MGIFAAKSEVNDYLIMRKSIKWIFTVGLSGALVPVFQKIFSLIPWGKFVDLNNWGWLIAPKFSILSIVIFVVLFICIVYFTRNLFKKNKEKQLKKINSWIDDESGIKITWDVGIGSFYNNNPFAYNIQIFCTKHGEIPIRMIHGRCTNSSCMNHNMYYNEHLLKNQIESMLLHEKSKL